MNKRYRTCVDLYLDEAIEAECEVLQGQGDVGEEAEDLVCGGPEVDLVESELELPLDLVRDPPGAEHLLLCVLVKIGDRGIHLQRMGAGNTAGLIVPFTRKKDQNFTETNVYLFEEVHRHRSATDNECCLRQEQNKFYRVLFSNCLERALFTIQN